MSEEQDQLAEETTTETSSDTTHVKEAVSAEDAAAAAAANEISAEAGKTAESPLDAISKAIDETGKPRTIQSKADQTPEEKAAAVKAEDDAAAEKGRVRGPDGKFRAMTDDEKKAKDDAGKAKPDHVNDPIPKDINPRTGERMKYLVDTVKQQAELVKQHGQLFETIQGTGASPQEFAQMVNYMRAVHTSDPVQLQQAYAVLQNELRGLAIKLGKPLPEVNLLTDPTNADLVEDIRQGRLSNQRAHELAVARESQKSSAKVNQEKTDQEKFAETEKREHDQAVADMDSLDAVLRGRDGVDVFAAKHKILVPLLKEHFKRLEYKFWKETYEGFYNNLTLEKAPAVVPAPVTRTPVPLRPKAPAGGQAPAAHKSALDAINDALGM